MKPWRKGMLISNNHDKWNKYDFPFASIIKQTHGQAWPEVFDWSELQSFLNEQFFSWPQNFFVELTFPRRFASLKADEVSFYPKL